VNYVSIGNADRYVFDEGLDMARYIDEFERKGTRSKRNIYGRFLGRFLYVYKGSTGSTDDIFNISLMASADFPAL
jgi:hypothetical protein